MKYSVVMQRSSSNVLSCGELRCDRNQSDCSELYFNNSSISVNERTLSCVVLSNHRKSGKCGFAGGLERVYQSI